MIKSSVYVTKRRGKRGIRYELRWLDPKSGLTRTKAIGKDKTYARLQAADLQRELESGKYIGLQKISYDDFKTEHLKKLERTLGERTINEHKLVLKQFKEACKPKDLTVIDFNMLEDFRSVRLSEGVAVATVNKGLITLQAAVERAVRRLPLHSA